jgi:hypothetical protein
MLLLHAGLGVKKIHHKDILSVEEIGELTCRSGSLRHRKIRVTGGDRWSGANPVRFAAPVQLLGA